MVENQIKNEDQSIVDGADRLLNKYLAVWLWSILFSANSVVVFSLTGLGSASGWKQFAFVLLLPALGAALFAIFGFLSLYRALTHYLLPRFFDHADGRAPDQKLFAYLIQRAFAYLMAAAVFRLITALTDLALSAFSGRG